MKLGKLLQTAHRIYEQQRHDKDKIYSVHEPEVQCIAKVKAGKQYEFGNKVSVAVSSRCGWFVGAKSFTGNPYDGHTLAAQMKQVESRSPTKSSKRTSIWAIEATTTTARQRACRQERRRGRTSEARWRWMKRRAAVEPSIGHLKNEHRLEPQPVEGDCRK